MTLTKKQQQQLATVKRLLKAKGLYLDSIARDNNFSMQRLEKVAAGQIRDPGIESILAIATNKPDLFFTTPS